MVDLPDGAALIVVDVEQGFDDPHWDLRTNPGEFGTVADAALALSATDV